MALQVPTTLPLAHPLDQPTIVSPQITEEERAAAQALLQLHTVPCVTKKKPRHYPSSRQRRPQWEPSERLTLLRAVIHEKKLHDMTTFHWDNIARSVQRTRKACKDQWRREILPMLLKDTPQ